MKRMGWIDRLPKLSVIQAEGASPLANLFRGDCAIGCFAPKFICNRKSKK
jgi:hypothetical protein